MTGKEDGMTSIGGDAETPLTRLDNVDGDAFERLRHERGIALAPKQTLESAI